jgi:hypothetical protein
MLRRELMDRVVASSKVLGSIASTGVVLRPLTFAEASDLEVLLVELAARLALEESRPARPAAVPARAPGAFCWQAEYPAGFWIDALDGREVDGMAVYWDGPAGAYWRPGGIDGTDPRRAVVSVQPWELP